MQIFFNNSKKSKKDSQAENKYHPVVLEIGKYLFKEFAILAKFLNTSDTSKRKQKVKHENEFQRLTKEFYEDFSKITNGLIDYDRTIIDELKKLVGVGVINLLKTMYLDIDRIIDFIVNKIAAVGFSEPINPLEFLKILNKNSAVYALACELNATSEFNLDEYKKKFCSKLMIEKIISEKFDGTWRYSENHGRFILWSKGAEAVLKPIAKELQEHKIPHEYGETTDDHQCCIKIMDDQNISKLTYK